MIGIGSFGVGIALLIVALLAILILSVRIEPIFAIPIALIPFSLMLMYASLDIPYLQPAMILIMGLLLAFGLFRILVPK